MKISLSPDVERLITERVSSGRYHSADEVVREGLEALQQRESKTSVCALGEASHFLVDFENIARDVPDADWASIPSDLSKNLDHYLYGSQKTS